MEHPHWVIRIEMLSCISRKELVICIGVVNYSSQLLSNINLLMLLHFHVPNEGSIKFSLWHEPLPWYKHLKGSVNYCFFFSLFKAVFKKKIFFLKKVLTRWRPRVTLLHYFVACVQSMWARSSFHFHGRLHALSRKCLPSSTIYRRRKDY